MYLTAAINEVEEPKDPVTGGEDNAYGGIHVQLEHSSNDPITARY